MSKPPFNPDQPFDPAKPAFDPNAPFTATAQDNQPAPSLMDRAVSIADKVNGALNYAPELPPTQYPVNPVTMAPNRLDNTFQKAGDAVAGYLGQKFPNHPYLAAAVATPISMANPENWISPKPNAIAPSENISSLANDATKSASSRWFKGMGGTLSNANEIGADEALRLGRSAREQGHITPLNGSEAQGISVDKSLNKAGKRIGDLRALADLHGNAPEAMKIVQIIQQDLGAKYGPGINVGESGNLKNAVDEILKLSPIDKLTPTEELQPRMQNSTIEHGVPSDQADPWGMIQHKDVPPKQGYEQFRASQEDPNYIPEYDIRRPTTFNEVAKVATDLNKHAKGQSKLLVPSGATTDVANTVSRLNNDAIMKSLPTDKGIEYKKNLGQYEDLSKLQRLNELKQNYEVGGSRNHIVNNIMNRVYHMFGHQLTAQAMDTISTILNKANGGARAGAMQAASTIGSFAANNPVLHAEYIRRHGNPNR